MKIGVGSRFPTPTRQLPVEELQYRNILCFASSTIHSRPSLRFFPVIALHSKILHGCVVILSSSSS